MLIDETRAATLRRMQQLGKFCLRMMLIVFTLNMALLTFNAEAFLEAPSDAEHASACDGTKSVDSSGTCSGTVCNHLCHAAGHFLGYITGSPRIYFPHTSRIQHPFKDAIASSSIADSQFRPPRIATLS